MYMVDIKHFAKKKKRKRKNEHTIQTISQNIGIDFGIEKSSMLIMKRVKRQIREVVHPLNPVIIRTLR